MRLPMLIILISFLDTGQSNRIINCSFHNDTKNVENEKLMSILSSIVGLNLVTQKNGYKYEISLCSYVSENDLLGTVTRSRENEKSLILGRRNDTKLIQGDNWKILVFGSGDFITGKNNKLERRIASVYIVCNPDTQEKKPKFDLTQEDGINYIFVLSTENVCHFNEEMSGLKIFLIIFTISFSFYCLLGVAYKKFVHNAQNCQQIPNIAFWSRIGNKLADGCNYICRCDEEREDSWNNITSNFECGDRDDALLRP